MSQATKYMSVLRELGFPSWKEFGRHLFEEIPQDENGTLSATQIRSYIHYSFGLDEQRAGEFFKALRDIGIIEAGGSDKDRYSLHGNVKGRK